MREYINWSLNMLLPIHTGAADRYLILHRDAVLSEASRLLIEIGYKPGTIYRGLLLEDDVNEIKPHENFQYLSFTDDKNVADHFADPVNGFGNGIIDLKELGEYGYVIEYIPKIEEVLYHYKFLDLIDYGKYIDAIGMDGASEIAGLKKQREITILQPVEPFVSISKHINSK
jgi:hypothetical protein